jgi:hypothetical protein
MNCLFCQKDLYSVQTLEEREPEGEYYEGYDCEECQADFIISEKTQQVVEYTLRNGWHRMCFDLVSGECEIQKARHLRSDNSLSFYETIVKLSVSPQNVTPQNLEERIQTLLTFS